MNQNLYPVAVNRPFRQFVELKHCKNTGALECWSIGVM